MKLDKIKSNPTQFLMYGILALFSAVIMVWVLVRSFSGQANPKVPLPSVTPLAVSTHQTTLQVAGNTPERSATASTHSTPASLAGTASSSRTESAPSAASLPPGINPSSPGQGTSTVVGPPSNSTPPSSVQTVSTQSGPPSNVTPPPTLQTIATQSGPPSNVTPPPTLQTTPTESGPPSNVTPPPTPTPVSAGPYDDTNTAWRYSGDWAYITRDSGPYNKTIHATGTAGNYVELYFRGTGFTFTFTKGPDQGLIDVFIDGARVHTIDAQNDVVEWQATWSSNSLANSPHTVRFVYAGSGTNIEIDAITIQP